MGTTRNKPYRAYMRSRKWKRFRKQRILEAGERCEKCNSSIRSLHQSNEKTSTTRNLDQEITAIVSSPKRKRWRTNTLQVHHVWYDNLYHETNLDTRVLCKTPCHKLADAKRKKVQAWLFKAGYYKTASSNLPVVSFQKRVEAFTLIFCQLKKIKVPKYVTRYLQFGY